VAAAEGPTPALADERHPSPDGEGR
jgi:hypothetical protein